MYPISSAVRALFEAEQRQLLRITWTEIRHYDELSAYSGSTRIYKTGNGQTLKLYQGATEVFDSTSIGSIITLYAGDMPIYTNDASGATIHHIIRETNVLDRGFQIDRFSCNGQRLEIGTAVAAELTLKLDNREGQFDGIRFEGADLFVEIGIADWTEDEPTVHWVPCGHFIPDSQPRTLSTITVRALDRMMNFDQTADADALTLPTTVAGLVTQASAICGVPLTQDLTTLPNYDTAISALPELQQTITYRNLIQWCAGIMGTNAWMDWDGELRFSWYDGETDYTCAKENRFSSDLYENDIAITGVQYTNIDGVTTTAGDTSYALDLTGNFLITDTNATQILSGINGVVNGFTYRPFTAQVVNAPYLWPMDMVTFTDKDLHDHDCALTNVNFNINGMTALQGKGETSQMYQRGDTQAFTARQAYMVQKAIEATLDEVDESLTQQDIFNRLTDNGTIQGLYMLNGQLYVNMSYARTGTLVLGGANNQRGILQVQDAGGNLVGQWDNTVLNIGPNGKLVNSGLGSILSAINVELSGGKITFYDAVSHWVNTVGLSDEATPHLRMDSTHGGNGIQLYGPENLRSDATPPMPIYYKPILELRNGGVVYVEYHRLQLVPIYDDSEIVFGDPAGARASLGAAALSDIVAAHGTKQFGTLAAGTYTNDTISIGTTLSSANYTVILEPVSSAVTVAAQNKTTTTFDMYIRNVSSGDATGTVTWTIIMWQ